MSTTRNGKIARLSKHVRHQLNRRLEDGEPGKQLVEWLNGLPEVQDTLKWQFGGRPVSEQNLSEWKQGGYRDWLQHQESCDFVQRLTEQAEDLEGDSDDGPVSDRFATLLAVELARVAEALLKESADPRERWQCLRELLQELGQLRRDDHHAARLRMEQECWNLQTDRVEKQEREQEMEKMKRQALAPIWAALEVNTLAPIFGGGDRGRQIAALIAEVNNDLKPGTLAGRKPTPQQSSHPIQADQTESNPIQPDPDKPAFPTA